ncbi:MULTISPECIES: lycopene cyclase domain-containing protein [Nocardia]|uniref:lycopene cyclase domain-containing protein n=1 Tax=Nocardia TaxID=1817 RepID=UPI00135AAA17|nr:MULTISPECIES: lycopene cyclase domain-containing protein [Nocardia]UAK35832.1 lycopene cyclase domain-containing protein [Nocardia asteroides]
MSVVGPGYTLPAVVAVVGVCLVECALLRTGLFRRPGYWLTMLIVLGFQIPVDGWLTRLDAPIVRYNPEHILGLRFPWDIPVEDFLFGFVLVTSVLLGWERARQRQGGVRQ